MGIANGIDFWIITTGVNNNSKYAFLLSSTGLSTTAVISNVGTLVSDLGFTEVGYLK